MRALPRRQLPVRDGDAVPVHPQLKAQGHSRACNESKKEEAEEGTPSPVHLTPTSTVEGRLAWRDRCASDGWHACIPPLTRAPVARMYSTSEPGTHVFHL